MKNTINFKAIQRMAGITAMVAVIGFSIAACDDGNTTGGGKQTGATVAAPTGTSSVTNNSVTLNAVAAPSNGQTVEYGRSTSNIAPALSWQDSPAFTGLTASTKYWFFARTKENATHKAGAASEGYEVSTQAAGKQAGAAVAAPASTSAITSTSITLNAVTAPSNGQSVEYAKNTENTAPEQGWQDSTAFTGLTASTKYWFFARAKENSTHNAGAASEGYEVTTLVQAGLYLGAVTDFSTATPIAGVPANDINTAFSYVNDASKPTGEYTLLLTNSVNSANRTLSRANCNVTIVSLTPVTITSNAGLIDRMFSINANTSLTLGNNITLQGKETSVANSPIYINGGTFIMKSGSKITGHTTSSDTGAVYIGQSTSKFIMEGGEISGNTTSNAGTMASGGVYMYDSPNTKFTMSGGTIKDNTAGPAGTKRPADLFASNSTGVANKITLSGNAAIGAVTLASSGSNKEVSLTLASDYNGHATEKTSINLYASYGVAGVDAMSNVIGAWYDTTKDYAILRAAESGGAESGTLTSGQLAKFTLGVFMCQTPSGYDITTPGATQNITGNSDGKDNYNLVLADSDKAAVLELDE
ncbi:MAG: hypothetical protein LBH43_08730 [Treponema sp.]|jgi:hypothetical protein|nr:hypothetical protein [Treponema sp.]